MKKIFTVPVMFCALCCLLAAGCNDVSEKELYYDATVEPNRIAASGYPETYNVECCVIFDAGFLRRYVGWDIVAIKLFNPVDNQTISYTPVMYEADAKDSSPGNPVSSNTSPTGIAADTWQTITLEKPVTIEASRDYWAGYSAVTIPGVNLLAQGAKLNHGNSRISFNGGISFQKASSNFLVRIVVRR
jgi:hypothetical protein